MLNPDRVNCGEEGRHRRDLALVNLSPRCPHARRLARSARRSGQDVQRDSAAGQSQDWRDRSDPSDRVRVG